MYPLPLRLAAVLLALVFAWSALAKPLNFRDWRAALARYALGEQLTKAALVGVPLAEITVFVLLLVGRTRSAAALTLFLLAGFSLAVLRARRAAGDKLPCGCFGKLKKRDYRITLARNALLAFVAAVLLVGGEDFALFEGFGAPRGSEFLAATLLVLGVAMSGWLLHAASTSLGREEI